MIYADLFKQLERVRWALHELPWSSHDASKLSHEQALTIKMNAITEWSSLAAAEMFLRDNRHDSDFAAFISVWHYEEMKHALVLIEYLRRCYPSLAPTQEELAAVRFEFDAAPPDETLAMHFCGELRLTQWYLRAAQWHSEPLIRDIYRLLSADEARHAAAYFRYMQRAIELRGDVARCAFAKIGALMTNSIAGKAMHPTNLHVNAAMFPNDTVQSRLPDPHWLERWLDEQIRFDAAQEDKVNRSIFAKLTKLLGTPLRSSRDLRKRWLALAKPQAARHSAAAEKPGRAQRGSPVTLAITPNISQKGTVMNAISDHVKFEILDSDLHQIRLDFDTESNALWVNMKPHGRPCFSREFMSEVRRCQHMIEATQGKVMKCGRLHNLEYVVLRSAVEDIFNLGGDLELFANLVETQDRTGLMNYARECIDISYHNYRNYNVPLVTVSLVQGHALGGGFESALSSSLLIAERRAKFGLPEVSFNLFPGMGAYTYLARKVGLKVAEQIITSGELYTAERLHDLGVIDILADDGQGEQAVLNYAKQWKGKHSALGGMMRARQRFQQVSYDELLDTAAIWVDTALAISERDLRMMQRLVQAQNRRLGLAMNECTTTPPQRALQAA